MGFGSWGGVGVVFLEDAALRLPLVGGGLGQRDGLTGQSNDLLP